MFQQDREGKSDNFVDPAERIGGRSGKGNRKGPKNFRKGQNSPRNREGQKQQRRPKTSQKGQKSRKGRKIQFENKNNNLEILEETNLGKVVENLQGEVKRFNKEVEKIRLEGQKPEKFKERIKEGRVLPPLLRSLQLLLQR